VILIIAVLPTQEIKANDAGKNGVIVSYFMDYC